MILLLWLFLLTTSSLLFTNRFFPEDSPAEKFLHILVFFYGKIYLVFTVLGCLGSLRTGFITLIFSLFFLLALFFCRFSWRKNPGFSLPLTGQIAIAFCLSVYLLVIDFQSFLPPMTTDGLLYHLPFAVHYLKSGSLSYPPLFFQDIAMTYYPCGGDLIYTFSLFSGNEHILRFTQLPMMAVASLSLFLILLESGFSRQSAILAASLLALVRPLTGQTFSCFVDLMMTGWFLATVYYFSTGQAKKITLGLVAAGLLIGTKNFALLYLLLALPVLAQKRISGKRIFLLSGFLFFAFIGGFSYLRNLFLLGNPFFPADISLGHWTIFPGIYVYQRGNFFPDLFHILHLFLRPTSLTDPAATVSILLFAGWVAGLVTGWRFFPRCRYLLLVPVLSVFLYSLLIPPAYHQIRHLLPVYAWLVSGMMIPLELWAPAKILLLPIFLGFARYTVPVAAWNKWAVFFLLTGIPAVIPGKRKRLLIYLVCGIIFVFYFAYWRFPLVKHKYNDIKYLTWSHFYPDQASLWAFVRENSGQGKTIAYAGAFFLYPLYGDQLRNSLYYQSVNSLQTRLIHEYPRQRLLFPAQSEEISKIYRENPDVNLWLEGLLQHQIDWVVLRKDAGLIELAWIMERPDCFQLLWENYSIAVYQFSPSRMIHTARLEKILPPVENTSCGLSFCLSGARF